MELNWLAVCTRRLGRWNVFVFVALSLIVPFYRPII